MKSIIFNMPTVITSLPPRIGQPSRPTIIQKSVMLTRGSCDLNKNQTSLSSNIQGVENF